LAEVWDDLSALSKGTRSQIRSRYCARVDVEIVYPAQRPESKAPLPHRVDSLVVKAYNSHIMVDMPDVTFQNKLSLSSADRTGSINIVSAASAKQTNLYVEQGTISGLLATQGRVQANVEGKGEIVLDIDGNDNRVSTTESLSTTLDVRAKVYDGHIQARLFSPVTYQGRFNLIHSGKVQIRRSSDRLPLKYTTNTSSRLAGFITADGKEPNSPLPNIELQTERSGDVTLELIG